MSVSPYYVTTSIPYVNADPHLGFALEAVQGDVLARHRRSRGDLVRFQTGTDDNSLKNVQAAEQAGVPVATFVDRRADTFAALGAALDLSYDDFIRTSRDPRHRPGAERLWLACADAGDLYRKHYEGRYCVGCEQFYTDEELAVAGGRCPEHGTVPQLVSEENWFFRLSSYAEQLLDVYAGGRVRIEPRGRANEVLAFIRGGLTDFSISRSASRARGWGVPVPGDLGQVMYVWWDALGNYLTALDYGLDRGPDRGPVGAFDRFWAGPGRRVHVIGKGIVRFHAVYWPAMLLSAGLSLPTEIFVHDYLTVNGRKLSKSLGNGVDPARLAGEFGADAVRWWLVSAVPRVGDADFTVAGLVDAANRDLAGGVGNLAQRVVTMVHRYRDGVVPSGVADLDTAVPLLAAVGDLPGRVDDALAGFDLRRAAGAITEVVAEANRYVERVAPWALARLERAGDRAAGRQLDVALGVLIATCRTVAAELTPFLPSAASRLAAQCRAAGPDGRLPAPEPLFQRITA